MLSYRHGFHAGNHADVLKHLVQILCLDHLLKKPGPISYIDTHAGAGYYAYSHHFTSKNREHLGGIDRLSGTTEQNPLPAPLRRYLEVIDACRRHREPGYPGSPIIALSLLRDQDRAHLFELHPSDNQRLQQQCYRRARIEQRDGFQGAKGLLPPPERRGLVLIDPPFEIKADYQTVQHCLNDYQRRFAGGIYALWYPLLNRAESQQLQPALSALSSNWLHCSLSVSAPTETGMYGSAMFVINPPWTLPAALQQSLPLLAAQLGEQNQGSWTLNHHIP